MTAAVAPRRGAHLSDPAASPLVTRSLRGAIDRLDRSEACRAVLSDFATPEGASLASVLAARGESPFKRHLARRADEARAVLIHEALHTLGRGEDPPSAREIQKRVLARCGPRPR